MKTFKQKWGNFLGILFGPGSAIFTVATVVGLILAYHFKENVMFSTLLTIISSIFAGIAGNFLKDDYDAYLGKNILEKKGRSAIRNLEMISTQLSNLRVWIIGFKNKKEKISTQIILSELDRHVSTIQLNINSGLEDWVDIVPELREKVEETAQVDKKYKDLIQSYIDELLAKRKELIVSKDKASTDVLKSKIKDIEKQIETIKNEQSITNPSLLSWDSGSNFITAGNSVLFGGNPGQCQSCHKFFVPNNTGISAFGSTYCDH